MPSFSTLIDNFNDNSLDTSKWISDIYQDGTLTEQNQRLELAVTSVNDSYAALFSNYVNAVYDLTNSYALIEIKQLTLGNTIMTAGYQLADINGTGGVEIYVMNGNLIVKKFTGVNVETTIGAYNSSVYKWFRGRVVSSVIYLDYSTDGVTWVNMYSAAVGPTSFTTMYAGIFLQSSATTVAPSTFYVDNFNVITVATAQAQTGKARLTVTTTKTQTGKARLTNIVPRTQTGKTRIQFTRSNIQTGHARIFGQLLVPQTGKANITNTTLRTQTGKAAVAVQVSRVITGKAYAVTPTPRTQQGRTNIGTTESWSQLGVARIIKGFDNRSKPMMAGQPVQPELIPLYVEVPRMGGVVPNL